MRQEKTQRQIRTRGIQIAAALAAAVALFAAGPAQARNEFQNGFEDQLGRIAAVGAVNLGLHVLSGGAYYGPPAVAYYPPPAYYGYGPRHVVKHHVVEHRVVHKHKHGRSCGHHYRHGRWHDDDDYGRRGHGYRYGRNW
jgi:hypothetical protein